MITIPDKLYVGLQLREKTTPLGFVTPDTDDAAFFKRKATVDAWANGYSYQKKKPLEPLNLKNELQEPYTIADDIRRYGWGSGNVVWRMVDPRGFEFEISSANMASIIDCSTIINGVIQGKCIFGREGAQNVLLPEGSQPYKDASTNTERTKKKISMKDVKVGDRLLLKDGRKVIFAGSRKVLFNTSKEMRNPDGGRDRITEHNLFDLRQRYIFVETLDYTFWSWKQAKNIEKGSQILSSLADLHVSEILERNVAIDVNLLKSVPETPTSTHTSRAFAVFDTKAKVSDLKINLKEITFEDMEKLMNGGLSQNTLYSLDKDLLWQDTSGKWYVPSRWINVHGGNRKQGEANVDVREIKEIKWDEGKYFTVYDFYHRHESSDQVLRRGKFFLVEVLNG